MYTVYNMQIICIHRIAELPNLPAMWNASMQNIQLDHLIHCAVAAFGLSTTIKSLLTYNLLKLLVFYFLIFKLKILKFKHAQ